MLGNSQRVVVRNVVQGVKGRREDRKELLFYSSQGKLDAAFLLPASSLRCSGFSYFCLLSHLIFYLPLSISIIIAVFVFSLYGWDVFPIRLFCALKIRSRHTYITWDHIFRLDGRTFFDDQSPSKRLCQRSMTYRNFLLESWWHFRED